MKTFQSVARAKETLSDSEQYSSGPSTVQRKEYEARTSFPLAPAIQLKERVPDDKGVVQLTKDSAAKELFDGGNITVKKTHFKAPFNKKHAVTVADLEDVQKLLTALRESAPKKEKPKAVDMTDTANWHTAGGMDEGDGKVVAGTLGWTEDVTQWTCKDKSHTPKGRVYTNGEGAYYGADNTGHVGWGFKVWDVNKGKELNYKGNVTWNGTGWVYRARGTK